MSGTILPANQPSITLIEAKRVLGNTVEGLSDTTIMQLVAEVDVLTDIVVDHLSDSKIQTSLANLDYS